MILALLMLLLLLISVGQWRSTGVGPQVQVPMFYDAHYLFPRPWTQAQEAPGVPPPAPVAALYGPNRVSQPFISGADQLSMVEVWLAGPVAVPVEVSLSGSDGLVLGGEVDLTAGIEGAYYHLSFPPIPHAKGNTFRLTLSAPLATAAQPVTTRAVGGDRLGGALWLNEYRRAGNLALHAYANGWPGRWWLDALAEQLLPRLFRLRLQQYKPDAFKGAVFPALLALTVGLSFVYLVLAMPSARPLSEVLAWATIGLLLAFLVWQVGSGRLRLPFLTRPVSLAPASDPLPVTTAVDDTIRIVNDLSLTLWTAQREPEARFVATDTLAGLPAIRVPADSRLSYDMTVPLNGRLRTGLVADGSGQLRFVVRFGDEEIATQTVTAISEEDSEEIAWLDLDLSRWAGRAGPLRLVTESVGGTPDGLWIMPQVQATPTWLLSHPLPADVRAQSAGYQFGDGVELVGYEVTPPSPGAGEPATVTLYWRALSRLDAYATVFVHLLDDQGQIRAQHDGQPVSNTYPLPTWQPGTVIADRHPLSLPDDLANGHYTLAVGLYDPGSLERWPVVGPDGRPQPDNRALLTTSLSVGATP